MGDASISSGAFDKTLFWLDQNVLLPKVLDSHFYGQLPQGHVRKGIISLAVYCLTADMKYITEFLRENAGLWCIK